jgi:hypothetical protein
LTSEDCKAFEGLLPAGTEATWSETNNNGICEAKFTPQEPDF